MDHTSLGDCGCRAEARKRRHLRQGGADQSAVIREAAVVDGDACRTRWDADILGQGQAAPHDQLAHLVGVARDVVALIPAFTCHIWLCEAIFSEAVDAQAAIVPHCPRPEIPGDAQKLVHSGFIVSLLPEECVGGVPVGDGCGPVLPEAGGHCSLESESHEGGADVDAVREDVRGGGIGAGGLQGRHEDVAGCPGLHAHQGGGEGHGTMGLEEVWEWLLFVDSHHGGIEGEGVGSGVQEVQLALNALYCTMAAVVEKGLRALVEGGE